MMTRRGYFNEFGNESGFTLIELIVGGLVAMLVLAGIVATMTMSQRNYFVQDRVSEAQQGGRIGLDLVVRDSRLAGHGFPRGTADKLFYYPAAGGGGAIVGIVVPGGVGALFQNNAPAGAQLAGTDAIAIKSFLPDSSNDDPIRVIKHPAPPAVSMQLEKPTAPATPPAAGDILMCETPDGQFTTICVTNINTAAPNFDLMVGNAGGAGSCPQGFNSPGGPGADYTNGQCKKIQSGTTTTKVYYVADATVAGSAPVGRLMFWNGGAGNPVVVANDVEDFQVSYCTAACDTAPVWNSMPSTAGGEDANIRLVRISLVTRTAAQDPKFSSSPSSVTATTPTPGLLDDHPLSAALDGFRRRLLSTMVQVRNNTLN